MARALTNLGLTQPASIALSGPRKAVAMLHLLNEEADLMNEVIHSLFRTTTTTTHNLLLVELYCARDFNTVCSYTRLLLSWLLCYTECDTVQYNMT